MMRKTEGSGLQYPFACCYIPTVPYIYKPNKLNTSNERLFVEVKKVLAGPSFRCVHGCVPLGSFAKFISIKIINDTGLMNSCVTRDGQSW